jgi:hypothetical protein
MSDKEKSVSQAIERAKSKLSAPISRFRVRVGKDSTDEFAVWVTLVLEDRELDRIWARRDELRNQVAELVRQAAGEEYWPYVSFQSTSEQTKEAAP